MTEQLDLFELEQPDEVTVDEWDLGPACSIDNDECEACQ